MQFDLSPRRVDLIGEGFDLAIRVGIPAEPNLVARRLVLAQRGIYASPAFLTNHRKPRIPADLSALSCLTVDHPDGNNTWVLRRGRNVEEVAVHGRIKANNARMLLQLAIEGVGIAVADELTASGFVQTGRLRRLLHGWEITPVPIYAVTGSRMLPTKDSPICRSFRSQTEAVRGVIRTLIPAPFEFGVLMWWTASAPSIEVP